MKKAQKILSWIFASGFFCCLASFIVYFMGLPEASRILFFGGSGLSFVILIASMIAGIFNEDFID